ncbi:C-type lectin lectoxin-Phi1-like [Haliotis rubra]|uniref:C-type lectin lectoxin-Phi1-like n=1 Tax=Haliotis rubra TaxID=36100 RepID=UPI001EE5D40D|nr:C-type lectin lectoxin-Phi1-like [Haliotis rubra]
MLCQQNGSLNNYGAAECQIGRALATVGSDCELDVDCMSLSHAHCHEGSCWCDVGHRLDGNTCRNHIGLCASTPGYTWDVGTDMCYRIVTNVPKNWADAEGSCSINQGHLIKLDTASKNDKLRALLNDKSLNAFWIGARVMPDAETWRWHDNTAIMPMQWGTGEPSGDGKCMDLLRNQAYKWNDEDCRRKQNYICEIPLN